MTGDVGASVWFDRAKRVIPGGVNSPVRAFGSVGGDPYFVASARGPYVTDTTGRRLIDLVQSYGAIIAGHAHPAIVDAVVDAARGGTSYGAPTEREVLLAEAIVDAVSAIDMVRLVSSGTEATMSAIRLARGFTGRDVLVKFAGCYHGHSDSLLAQAGSSVAQLDAEAVRRSGSVPGSAGVPEGAVATTRVVPFDVVPELDETVAAVIVEPIAANMGLVAPSPGFLQGLAEACRRVGALLIFDEVITGFRCARGGATEVFGVTPDLVTLGKVIGGGLPVGAFGGRAEIMERLAPLGPVYQAGTLSGNPLATAAGLATLELLDDDAYACLGRAARRLASGLTDAFDAAGAPMIATTQGNLVGIFAGTSAPRNFADAQTTDEVRYTRFFHAMLDGGVALAPGAYEVAFCGLAHTDDVIDEVIEVAREAARVAAREVTR